MKDESVNRLIPPSSFLLHLSEVGRQVPEGMRTSHTTLERILAGGRSAVLGARSSSLTRWRRGRLVTPSPGRLRDLGTWERGQVMNKWIAGAVRFLREEDGPTAVEYAVMLALIVVVCIAAITTLGSNANNTFSNVALNAAVSSGS
jgi:pilus assembly protein Flp/PilA